MAADKPFFVNVNGHTVKSNTSCALAGADLVPIFAVRHGRGGKATYGHAVSVLDNKGEAWAQLTYEPFGGLGCGAKAFLVCREEPKLVVGDRRLKSEVTSRQLDEVKEEVPGGMTVTELILKLQVLAKINPDTPIGLGHDGMSLTTVTPPVRPDGFIRLSTG